MNPKCVCRSMMQAMFCLTGHMTECHYPLSCSQAECSHWEVEHLEDDQGDYEASDYSSEEGQRESPAK